MVLSDALEEYPVWYTVRLDGEFSEPTRDSDISSIVLFEDGQMKSYGSSTKLK